MNGKGIFIWQADHCENGEIGPIVEACRTLGLEWVAIKCGNGANPAYQSFMDMAGAVGAFHAAGMQVWLWHYVLCGWYYNRQTHLFVSIGGSSPEADAAFAREAARRLQADGLILDAEAEFKDKSQGDRARRFMKALGDVGKPVALCSYRFPSLHPEFPWEAFLTGCDVHMPQVYWQPPNYGQGPVIELDRSISELKGKRMLPVVPLGRAYIGDGHPDPKPGEISAFADRARQRDCPGISFWALDFLYLHKGGKERGAAIAEAWGGAAPPAPEPEPVQPGPAAIGKVIVTGNTVNLRAGAGVSFKDVGDVTKHVMLYVFEEAGPWVRVGVNVWMKTGEGLGEWVERYG
jgi:hypothetical protein